MPEITLDLSKDEYRRLERLAERQRTPANELAEALMSAEIARRYVLPSMGGQVVTLQLPKRPK